MASSPSENASFSSHVSKPTRKKTPGACEKCREKRIKCNGAQPCDQCSKRGFQCIFTFAPSIGSEVLAEKLDIVLSRIDRLEQSFNEQVNHRQRQPALHLLRPATRYPSSFSANGLTQLNPQTGCFEYYGGTSTFVLASSLGKRMRQLDETNPDEPPSRQPRREGVFQALLPPHQDRESLGLDELAGFCDYVVPLDALRHHRRLRESVAARHLDKFFDTIHIFLPIFERESFRAKYDAQKSLFGDQRLFLPSPEHPNRPQFLCLLYAVLALGALYEDEREDSSSWASWYFAEAQDSLGRLLDAANLELVQAAMLMGAYAQHAIKTNLAYILTGIATRLAFSIGLNTESVYRSGRFHAEESRRSWWLIYIQEVELSLDSGRPMSVRTSEMDVDYPIPQVNNDGDRVEASQVEFIRYLAEIAKIMRRILKQINHVEDMGENAIASDAEVLRTDLQSWRASLPRHLRFHEPAANDGSSHTSPCSWQARQQSSLRIHYNLAIIILLRGFLSKKEPDFALTKIYQESCLDAARDMVKHIHHIFRLAPSLRRWSYYCFYCLQATLVLLTKIVSDDNHPSVRTRSQFSALDEGSRAEVTTNLNYCKIGIQIFEQIELKASQRCAEVVRRFLEKCTIRMRRKGMDAPDHEHQTPGPEARHDEGTGGDWKRDAAFIQTHKQPTANAATGERHGAASTRPTSQLKFFQRQSFSTSLLEYSHPPFSWQEPVDDHAVSSKPNDGNALNLNGMPLVGDPGTTNNPTDGTDCISTSPDISLGGLQTELYGVLHGSNYDDYDFGFEGQQFLFGSDVMQQSDLAAEAADRNTPGHSDTAAGAYVQRVWL